MRKGSPGKVGHRGVGTQTPLGWGGSLGEPHRAANMEKLHSEPPFFFPAKASLPVTDVQKHLNNALQNRFQMFSRLERSCHELPWLWAHCPAKKNQKPAAFCWPSKFLLCWEEDAPEGNTEASLCSPAAEGMQNLRIFYNNLSHFRGC